MTVGYPLHSALNNQALGLTRCYLDSLESLIFSKKTNLDCLVWCKRFRCAVNHRSRSLCHGLLHEITSAII